MSRPVEVALPGAMVSSSAPPLASTTNDVTGASVMVEVAVTLTLCVVPVASIVMFASADRPLGFVNENASQSPPSSSQ
jgi:hypothetical protein